MGFRVAFGGFGMHEDALGLSSHKGVQDMVGPIELPSSRILSQVVPENRRSGPRHAKRAPVHGHVAPVLSFLLESETQTMQGGEPAFWC